MKIFSRFFVSILLISMALFVKAQTVDSNYEVATWHGFTEAAITYTFDDNCAKQYTVAIPMFDEFDFEGTFYPVISWGPQWAKFQKAADEGHEIGSHTVNHTNLGDLDETEQDAELRNSKEEIENKISGQACNTIAYPYCVPSNAEITNKYYIAARHCQGNVEKTTPPDFLNISSIICGSAGAVKTTANFISKNESAAGTNGWCVYLIHGIDGDGGYSSLDLEVLREGLEYLDENREKYWVSTFTNVVQYIRERNSASVTELELTDQVIKLEVTDTLDNSIYISPITLRRQLPTEWPNAIVLQNDSIVPVNVVEINSLKYVEFDVVPDAGVIEIQFAEENVSSSSILEKRSSISVNPNPFHNEIKIKAEGDFSYTFHDINGRLMEKGYSSESLLAGRQLSQGVYLLNVQSKNENYRMKIIKE